ncbi:MAG: TetR/AcrR family transcriptional regulator [Acidimicrobiales bacterium]
MTDRQPVKGERQGRRRLFDHDTERTMLMDAAVRILARSGLHEMFVVDVLSEAGLSTRSFYRHFESKDGLLRALVLRETESVAQSLERRIARASGPVAAVEAWLDGLLDAIFEPRRAARAALFMTPAVRTSYPVAERMVDTHWTLSRPLAEVLRAGHEAGFLVSPNPEADAVSMFALVGITAYVPHANLQNRAAVRAQVVRFSWPTLGLSVKSGASDAPRRTDRTTT